MKKYILGAIAALTLVLAAPVALASSASAYTAPTGTSYVGETVLLPSGATTTIQNVDLNVQLGDGSQWYHEYDLDFGTPHDGVIDFTGVGMQWDNDGEMINGVVNLDLRQLSFTAEYLTGGHKDGRVWTVTNAPLGGAATSGPIDFSAPSLDVNGSPLDIAVLGGITLPNLAPAPAPGNHGQCVSEAAHAGIKGTKLAAIAKVVTNVGAYGSGTCKTV